MKWPLILFFALFEFLLNMQPVLAAGGLVREFKSPNGVAELCLAYEKLPLGKYSEGDAEKEQEFCSVDFYNNSVALCPKTWSTSPGTIVRNNLESGKSSVASEATNCGHGSSLDSIAKFKQTMNRVDTSGTYSGAPILYYHFSRALDVTVDVSVAVYRTMDRQEHYQRVSSKARGGEKMNSAAWTHLRNAELNPASYSPSSDLFTADGQLYGSMSKDKGERYGVEISGTRASGWGAGQYKDFQRTPGFMALRSALDMPAAIEDGTTQAFKDTKMNAAFRGIRPSVTQVALWMKELSEIAILDFILSQQDRVGNIDYRWFWVYQDATGKTQVMKSNSERSLLEKSSIQVPAEIAAFNPVLVQKSFIGDNDAGGMVRYGNYAKTTGMLENLRHLSPETYRRLIKLASDFEQQGENYQVFVSHPFPKETINQTVNNTKMAAAILKKSCEDGKLKFDLVSYKDAYQNKFAASPVNCQNP